MSIRRDRTLARRPRWSARTLVPAAAMVLLVAPGIAGAGSGTAGADSTDEAQMITQAKTVEQSIVRAYNEKKWDDFQALYTEDAIAVPPNHEPIRGPAAITEYYRGVRDITGEAVCGEPLKATASGKLASLVGNCTAYSGRLRLTTDELYERQADGSVRYKVDMFGVGELQR